MKKVHIIVAAVVMCVLAVCSTNVATAATVRYAALGDSYSSGVGTGTESGPCGRSDGAYGPLWAARHGARFTFNACGGATTADVMSKQLAGLDQGTNLVSITIGGNDIGFIPIMTKCITSFNILCTQAVQAGIGLARSVLPNQLASTFAEIKAKAPRARLVVLGYPHLYQLGECSDWLLPDVHELINEGIDALDDVLADAAQVAGANYVDVRGEFANNEICSAHPWIRNLDFMSSSAYHPTALGQRYGYLAAFQRVTG